MTRPLGRAKFCYSELPQHIVRSKIVRLQPLCSDQDPMKARHSSRKCAVQLLTLHHAVHICVHLPGRERTCDVAKSEQAGGGNNADVLGETACHKLSCAPLRHLLRCQYRLYILTRLGWHANSTYMHVRGGRAAPTYMHVVRVCHAIT